MNPLTFNVKDHLNILGYGERDSCFKSILQRNSELRLCGIGLELGRNIFTVFVKMGSLYRALKSRKYEEYRREKQFGGDGGCSLYLLTNRFRSYVALQSILLYQWFGLQGKIDYKPFHA